MTMLWLDFLCDVIVDVLGVIGLMFNINPAYLGITFLAIGNSIGDTLADIGVAKRGYAQMAMVGCFAGPFFNMCIGLGLAMLFGNLQR